MYIYRFLLCNLIDLLNWWWSGVFIPNYGAQNQSVFTLLSLFELSKINLKSFPFFLISTSSFLSSRQLCNEPLTQRYWYLVSVFFSFVHLYSYDSDPVFLLPALFKGCAKSFGSVIPVHLFLSSSVMLSIFVILQKPPHAIYHRLFLSKCRFFPFLIFHLLPYFIDHASFDRSFVVSSTEAFTLPTFVRFYLCQPQPKRPPWRTKEQIVFVAYFRHHAAAKLWSFNTFSCLGVDCIEREKYSLDLRASGLFCNFWEKFLAG